MCLIALKSGERFLHSPDVTSGSVEMTIRKTMQSKNILLKIAKILSIIYILFISMFAFDMFAENWIWYKILIGFLIHLIPSFVLIALLVWAWKKSLYGGIAFIVLSIIFTLFFKTYQMWQSLVFLTLPLLIIGVLFILGRNKK